MRHATRVLTVSMFVMGACGLIYEYTLGALANNLIGSSHEQLFVVIGLMMFAMGVGSALQRNVEGDLIDKWLLVEFGLGIVGGTSVLMIYAAFGYSTSYRIVLYGYAMLIGMAIGMEIPLLIRINKEYTKSLRVNLSEVLFMDYAGSLVGALLFAYVLVTRFSSMHIAASLGLVNIALGVIGLVYFWPLLRWRKALVGVALFAIAGLAGILSRADALVDSIEQRTFRDPIVLSETTRYQHVVMTKRDERLNLYVNGHLQFSSVDEEIYHELLVQMPMAVARKRERVLILGGGDGLALREVLDHGSVREVVLVDIDSRITELAAQQEDLVALNRGSMTDARVRTFRSVPVAAASDDEAQVEGALMEPEQRVILRDAAVQYEIQNPTSYSLAQVEVYNVDADLFLREVSGLFDVVIIDFPDPTTLEVAKLYSRDFFLSLADHLAPWAIIGIQSTSPYHARDVFLCIGETMRAAGFRTLPYHQNVPSFGEWGWHLAWIGGPSEAERAAAISALKSLPVATSFATAEILGASLIFGGNVLAGPEIQPTSKMRPIILEYSRRSWKDS
ncbi:MAG: spermidine synthase [Planctomycetota bacterium]|jgi:spermidine synthase